MARYVPPYLLEELWRDRGNHVSSAILLRNGVVELGMPAGNDVAIASYRDLVDLAKSQRIRPMPSWEGFVKLAIFLSLRIPELDKSYPDREVDVATAAREFHEAEARLVDAIRVARHRGCTVSALAATVGTSRQQIASYVPLTAPEPPPLVVSRLAIPPVVAVLQSLWDDPSSDVNPLLTACQWHDSCSCRPTVVATRRELRSIATAKNVPVDADSRPTDDGFELLAEYLFGADLDAVQVADPHDPHARQLFDAWRHHRVKDKLATRRRRPPMMTETNQRQATTTAAPAPRPHNVPAAPSSRHTPAAALPPSSTAATRWRQEHHRATLAELGTTAAPAVRVTAAAVLAVAVPLLVVWFSAIAAAICWIVAGVWIVRIGARLREETMGYRALRRLANITIIGGLAGVAAGVVTGMGTIIG